MRAVSGMMITAVLCLGCGGGGGNPGGGGGGEVTATVDGQAFSSTQATAAANTQNSVVFYTITATQVVSGAAVRSLVLILYNVSGPGTYSLGVNSTGFGGIGTVSEGANNWMTPLNGTSGTLTITSLGSGRIAGTFSFTAVATPGAGSTRSVTGGNFDLSLTGTPGTVQPYQGSTLKATLGTTTWVAGTIVVNKSSGTYSFLGTSQPTPTAAGTSSVDIILQGVSGPGTFQFGGTSVNQVLVNVGGLGYSSDLAGSSGSVVVTSIDANRLKGTFSGTVGNAVGGSVTITNGAFDLGLGK